MWLSQIVQKKRHWQHLLSVLVLLLVNISFYSIGQLQLQQRQQQWQQWLALQPLQQQAQYCISVGSALLENGIISQQNSEANLRLICAGSG